MPFNYLLDWSLLENNNLNLKNSIIIFDEAHNVDSLAEEGSSMEIDTDMLAQCLV
jgi:regulator of telomere elongation helicase 1